MGRVIDLSNGGIYLGGYSGSGGSGVSEQNPNLAFNVDFSDGIGRENVSRVYMNSTLSAGRPKPNGELLSANQPAIWDGCLNTFGEVSQLVPYSEDTSQWAGTGPWTQEVEFLDEGIHTLSTDVEGATVTLTSGTANIAANLAGDPTVVATYGSPKQFIVLARGTATISSDTANPKAQITPTAFPLLYVKNSTGGILTTPHNYSDADEGYRWPLFACPDLERALNGTDGTDAQGTIEVEWTSKSTMDQYGYAINKIDYGNIISCNNSAIVLPMLEDAEISVSDGTQSVLSDLPGGVVRDKKYLLRIAYGPHPLFSDAMKMRVVIIVDGVVYRSDIVDFDGSFNPGDYFSIGFENPLWQQIKSINIFKEPIWD